MSVPDAGRCMRSNSIRFMPRARNGDRFRTRVAGRRAWRNGDLYISAVNRILRLEGIDARLDDPPRAKVVFDQLPRENAHGWKFIAFGPDGWLSPGCGSALQYLRSRRTLRQHLSCSPDGRYSSRWRGARTSVGLTRHPGTGEMWFTDNGRDGLGDDMPPDAQSACASRPAFRLSPLPRWDDSRPGIRERTFLRGFQNHRPSAWESSRCPAGLRFYRRHLPGSLPR